MILGDLPGQCSEFVAVVVRVRLIGSDAGRKAGLLCLDTGKFS